MTTSEINLGKMIYTMSGRTAHPHYGEVYEIADPGSLPGYVTVTAGNGFFGEQKAHTHLPSEDGTTARERAIADAIGRK